MPPEIHERNCSRSTRGRQTKCRADGRPNVARVVALGQQVQAGLVLQVAEEAQISGVEPMAPATVRCPESPTAGEPNKKLHT